MMILQSLLLFLIPSVLRILVLAAPIPNDHHASTHTNAPATHPPAVQLNANAHPVRHAPVQPGQIAITGTMPAHPDARGAGGMTQHQLDDHARHIAANLRTGPNAGPYVVHATHTPGHMNVRFKAVEDRQNRWAHNPEGHKDTAHHTLDVQANRRPVVNTPTMTDAQRNAMHQGLQSRGHQHTWHPVAAQPGQHGEGRHGTLMVDPAHQGSGLTQDQLKVHANFVAQHLFPHPQDHNVRIEVQHKPGDTHAHYRAVTADGGVINHHRGPTPQEVQAIQQHVAGHFAAGTAHNGGSINGQGNPLTFTGAIPAHPNIPHHVSPGHMQVYSAAIKTGLANQYGLTPQERNGLVVATLRTPGSNQVLFDTQPRHADVFNSANNLHPDLAQAHHNVGHVLNQNPNLPMVHADSRVLNHHLTNVGAAPGTASQHLQGAVLGIDGMGNQPCQNCHNVVSQFPVHYEGRNRAVHPNVQRAIDV